MTFPDVIRTLGIDLLGLLLAVAFATPSFAATDAAAAQTQATAKLEAALELLEEQHRQIASEKLPLSRRVVALEQQVLELRRQKERLQKVRDSRTIDLTSLESQITSMRENADFIDSRLDEFVRDFEGRIHIAELPRYEGLTAKAKLADDNASFDAEARRRARLAVVDAAFDRVRAQLGGQIFTGEALSPEGVLTEGTFIALGPTVFFSSRDGTIVGLVESQLNAADPVVVSLPSRYTSEIVELARNRTGQLPFDATLGKALKKEKASKTLAEYVADGGAVGYVIVALGLSAIFLIGFKAWEISRLSVGDPKALDDVMEALAHGDQAGAKQRALAVDGVAGDLMVTGVEHASAPRELLEEVLFEKILNVRPTLERYLPFLAITAAAAPLLGLLGTVIGMIKTFQLITIFGTGDAKSLSSGISEALVTTALGLIVAIPTLILHGWLSRMAKHKVGLLDQLSVAFVNGVSLIRHKALGSEGVEVDIGTATRSTSRDE